MSIESEINWLTLDAGARRAGMYLDQLKQQLDDCCDTSAKRDLAKVEAQEKDLAGIHAKLRQEFADELAGMRAAIGQLQAAFKELARPTPTG